MSLELIDAVTVHHVIQLESDYTSTYRNVGIKMVSPISIMF